MNVAMGFEGCSPVLSRSFKPGADVILPMQLRRVLRKLFFPGVQQWHRVAARHGEKQFKILPVAQRGQERGLGRRFRPWPATAPRG